MTTESEIRRQELRVLVMRAKLGDLEAFRQLVEMFDRRLLYFITRLINDAELALDVLQDTWLTVFKQLAKLQSPEAFRIWLYSIARGKGIDQLRRRQRALIASPYDETNEPAGDDDVSLSVADVDLVHTTLLRLSADHREVLVLHFLESMSIDEISQVTGAPAGTVKSRMYHAKRAFQRIATGDER